MSSLISSETGLRSTALLEKEQVESSVAEWSGRVGFGATVRILSGPAMRDHTAWHVPFRDQLKDSRYYRIVEETIFDEFVYRYFVFSDGTGDVLAIQPVFLVDQDLLAGTPARIQKALQLVRRFMPRFLKMRTLMVGCAAGEGRLDQTDPEHGARIAEALRDALMLYAPKLGASLVVMKEFSAEYRGPLSCLCEDGFCRVPSMPMTRLNIEYRDFEHYMTSALSKAMRKNLRRKFQAASAAAPITLSVMTDISPMVDELYPLYLQVYERSTLRFEKLTKEFFIRIGQEMPDKARFFVWRQNGRAIAFSLCMVNGDCLHDEYIGLDYSVALDLHLYFYTLRDIINWAIANKCRWYRSTALNYDPKLHLKHELVPLDLYVRHTSHLPNALLRRLLPLLEPARGQKTLRRFQNYEALWGN